MSVPLTSPGASPLGQSIGYSAGHTRLWSDEPFRLVADIAPVLIWMADADARCTYVNKPWLAFTGRTLDAELGDGWRDCIHPDDLSLDALRERAWQLIQPHYLERLRHLVEAYGTATSKGLGTDDVPEAAKAAIAGRIATLLIEADRQIPGTLDATTGAIRLDDLANSEVDDLLDDLGERVLKTGGQVVVVPSGRMPTQTGIAATYRF